MTNHQMCSADSVSRFTHDEMNESERSEFIDHLEHCEICRGKVEQESNKDHFWNHAIQQLGGVSQNEAIGTDWNEPPHTHEQDRVEIDHSVQGLLSALAPTDDPAMLGRIGEYEVSGVIGIGGMGAVLKGFDRSLMRVVAIKVLAPHLANKGSARKRFEREARAAAAVSHDNVINIFRVDELNGLPYLVMPFARGPSLQKRLDENGPLTALETVVVGKQIAAGLAEAHEQGLVHRDIKPANIVLNDCIERILITDFGVARAMDDASMTQTGLIAGTPQYMSPEQARGELVDHRSDLFSLGSLLYACCTGRPPFRGDAPFGVLRKITDSHHRPIVELNSEIPVWLEAIINRLLEKNPTDRFQNANEVVEVFERCLAHLRQPSQIALPRSVVELTTAFRPQKQIADKPTGTSKFSTAFFTAVAAGLLTLAGWFITEPPEINGLWKGESWSNIELKSVKEAQNWYAGTFKDAQGNSGAIHLEWSRLSQRFKGRWSIGSTASGTIVLRQGDGDSIRGALVFDSQAILDPEIERLRDFTWYPGDSDDPPKTLPNGSESFGYYPNEQPGSSGIGEPELKEQERGNTPQYLNNVPRSNLGSMTEWLTLASEIESKIVEASMRIRDLNLKLSNSAKSIKEAIGQKESLVKILENTQDPNEKDQRLSGISGMENLVRSLES
ncbi:MAG: protein kinase, partial [Planctomycetota bacterium]